MQQDYYRRHTPDGITDNRLITGSSRALLKEAEKHGVAWEEIPGTDIFKLEWQGKVRYFHHQITPETTALGSYLAHDKEITNRLLARAGLQVPKGFKLYTKDNKTYWKKVFDKLEKPVAVKPTHGSWGEDVYLNVDSWPAFADAVAIILKKIPNLRKSYEGVIAEEMFVGTELRILATNKQVIGVINRVPANVVGNGKATIEALIDDKNADPRRRPYEEHKPLTEIQKDEELQNYLAEQGFDLTSVPTKGEQVFLRETSNLTQGGDSIDVTDDIHADVKEIALAAMNALPGLAWAGLDFMTKDITQPQTNNSYRILEVNDSPGFLMHDQPYQGKKRYSTQAFLYHIFPELRDIQ